ncbi:unnamed protein product [Microthlaspi erraticum]|uniref:Uncharacterized protein n=1 Tax=Microthlaspi erraticum TaxID=1685480 RepID=A0A6D2JJP3_9BRAS|nr:unnamed protein product [Microthlaspi erraticum]
MFGMDVFRTFPSSYVKAQNHGNKRRIKIGDVLILKHDGDETLQTGKRTKPSGRGNVRMEQSCFLPKSGDTKLLGEDKDDLNQYGGDTHLLRWSQNHSANHAETLSCWNGTKLVWINRASTPPARRE